jgi:hypothetical protein
MFTEQPMVKMIYWAVVLVFLIIIFYKLSAPEGFSEFGDALNDKNNHYNDLMLIKDKQLKDYGDGEFRNELTDLDNRYRVIGGIGRKSTVLSKIAKVIGVNEHLKRRDDNEDPLFTKRGGINLSNKLY